MNDFKEAGFKEKTWDPIFKDNAARLLGLA
jgi:predicted TIM-barrel fold metal-dependent hydrolase